MRRIAATLIGVLLAGAASAQFSASLGGTFQSLRYYGLFPAPPSSNPLDVKGFGPKLPEKNPPVGPEPDNSGNLKVLKAGKRSDRNGIQHIEGGFSVEYKGYRMDGDVLDGNRSSQVFIISGNAVLTGPDAVVHARRIVVDYQSRTYEAYDGESELRPSLVGGVLETDVYAKARHGTGTEQEQFLDDGFVTTCNYPEPHYYLAARYTDLRFRRRIIFRDLSIWLLGHHLLDLPFLSIPLDDRHYDNLPTVGEDSTEGYFIKTNFGIPLKGDEVLNTRLDYMTKLGVGAGFDFKDSHTTGSSPYSTELMVYTVPGIQMLDITQSHNQTFRWGKISIQNTYTGNDYLTAPGSDILNSQVSVVLNQHNGTTGFSYTRSSNSGPDFSSINQSIGLTNAWSLGPFKETTQVTYTDSSSTFNDGTAGATESAVDNKSIDINFEADDDFKKAEAMLQYQRTIPVGTSAQSGFVGGTDQTPVISLGTDSGRLFGQGLGQLFPIKAVVSLGQFGDPTSGLDVTRDRLDLSFDKSSDTQKRASIDVQGQFSQSFYSDDTAEFVVGMNDTFKYRLGRDTSFNINYNYLKPEGYSPLGIDQVGTTNLLSEDISFRLERTFLLGVQSSYDFYQASQGSVGWSPVGIRVEYTPRDYILLRTDATYDPFYMGVANYRLDATYKPGATVVGLGVRYDNTRSTWAEVDLYISSFKWGRLKTDFQMSYNGYSQQFNSIQLALTYDLHCAEAIAQIVDNPIGFQSGTSFQFFIRIKGLPFDTSFGDGTRGQPFGYGTGVGY